MYPEPTSATKPPRSHSKGKSSVADSGSNSSDEDFDPNEQDKLPSIPDEDEPESATSVSGSGTSQERSRHSSNTSYYKEQSASVSPKEGVTSFSRSLSRPQLPRMNSKPSLKGNGISSSKWACLPKDVRFYMNYHKNHLTHHHYAMKYDTGDFLKTTFLEIALGYEPLLYAITGFSAYHHTLTIANGKIQNFLGYYNKSVSLLRQSLERSPRHTIATLLTILQLATFEVSRRHTLVVVTANSGSGIPGRLGQSSGSPEGRLRDSYRAFHTTDHHAERDTPQDHQLVHSV